MSIDKNKNLLVLVATPELPSDIKNLTGSPAHILKLCNGLTETGIRNSLIQIDVKDKKLLKTSISACGMINWLWRIPRTILRTRPSIIHCHGHKAACFILPYAWMFKIPVVCEIHGKFVESTYGQSKARPLFSRILKSFESPVLKRVDHIIVQAETMKNKIIRDLRIPKNKFTVIYPGLRTSEFTDYDGPAASIDRARSNEKVVLYIGSVATYQGLDILAEVQNIIKLNKQAVRFVLALSGNTKANATIINNYNFDYSLTTIMELADSRLLPSIIKAADVLIHSRPNCPENSNVQSKLGLYLASGKPVVTTNVGDYPLLLSGSRGCIVVEPDPYCIAEAIFKAFDADIVMHAQKSNPLLAKQFFDVGRNLEIMVSVYKKLFSDASSK